MNYKSDADAAAEAVVAAVKAARGKRVACRATWRVEGDVERVFKTVDDTLGRLSHLVYNSGITGKNSRVEAVEPSTMREVIDVNVLGALLAVRTAIPRMSTKHGGPGGAIVLLSSVDGQHRRRRRICLVRRLQGRDRIP